MSLDNSAPMKNAIRAMKEVKYITCRRLTSVGTIGYQFFKKCAQRIDATGIRLALSGWTCQELRMPKAR